jgi:hypothetical protein
MNTDFHRFLSVYICVNPCPIYLSSDTTTAAGTRLLL